MQIIQKTGPRTQDAAASSRLIDLQLIRQLLLTALGWPTSNREFVLGISAVSVGRSGWFPHGHEFTGHVLGYVGSEAANSQRVRRDLLQYERATHEIGYKLFDWKRGGGETKAITQYGQNYLNLAAVYIQGKIGFQHDHMPAVARIEHLIPEALALIPQTVVKVRKRRKSTKRAHEQICRLSIDAPRALNISDLSLQCLSALALEKKGLWIVPLHDVAAGVCTCRYGSECDTPGKHPRIMYIHQEHRARPRTIVEWWQRVIRKSGRDWKLSNVGVLTGTEVKKGWSLVVLDIDRRNRGDVALAVFLDELGIEIPETYTVETSDGEHYYLLVPTAFLTKAQPLHRGIDIKTRGHVVVGAGSVHISGVVYTARNPDAAIARMPDELIDLIFAPTPNRTIDEGERHKFLLRCAGAMAGSGRTRDQVLHTLRTERAALCVPGEKRAISDRELESIADYVTRKEGERRKAKRA